VGHTGGLDVWALGEAMALFVPGERPATWIQTVGGAESNVACHLAGLGLRSGWLGAVGDDELGRAVTSGIAAAGVDVSGVVIDPDRPTGLYLKEVGPSATRVRYYRSGSAASFLGPELLSTVDLHGIRLVHTSGITPALSASCLALMRALFAVPRRTHRISFDVNWRPALWAGQDVSVLAELANAADVVLVGADEADAVWGFVQPAQIREVLPGPDTLVVKHGEHGATLIERDPATGADAAPVFQPALTVVDVVETVGAGDAFAAGFLAATLAGATPQQRLRAGHLRAAGVLSSADDLGTPLPPDVVVTLLDAHDHVWASWRSAP
jgi:2-dehydro-3-deoxygluconokinase